MTIVPLLAQSAFEPEVIEILAAAFADAWASIEKSGSSRLPALQAGGAGNHGQAHYRDGATRRT